MDNYLWGFVIILNIIAFVIFGYDKNRAVNKRWRVPEKTLFLIAFIGGAAGAYLGMRVFHHKTKHNSFVYGIPILIILNILIFRFLALKII